MNVCITPDLFKTFCDELISMLQDREAMQNIDFTEIKNFISVKQTEYCE